MKKWQKAWLAVVLGNVLYFWAMPHLPPAARHAAFRVDLGLLVDAGFCLGVYGLLEWVARAGRRRG